MGQFSFFLCVITSLVHFILQFLHVRLLRMYLHLTFVANVRVSIRKGAFQMHAQECIKCMQHAHHFHHCYQSPRSSRSEMPMISSAI